MSLPIALLEDALDLLHRHRHEADVSDACQSIERAIQAIGLAAQTIGTATRGGVQ